MVKAEERFLRQGRVLAAAIDRLRYTGWSDGCVIPSVERGIWVAAFPLSKGSE